MRILILTDSLSLPRADVTYEDTYVYLLKQEFSNATIVHSAIGGGTIKTIFGQVFYYKNFSPDVVILQTGIVDCAPRAFRPFEKRVLRKLGLIGKLKKLTRFLRKNRGYTLTKMKSYEDHLKQIRAAFSETPVYAVGILGASDAYEEKVPHIKRNIECYNAILKGNTKFIDTSDILENGILADHHHLNKKGHDQIFRKLKVILGKMLNQK